MNYSLNLNRPIQTTSRKLEEVNIKELMHQYFLSKWYWYVIAMGLGITGAYFYLQTIQPEYVVKSKLMIKEDGGKEASTEDMLKRSLNLVGSSENMANEVQILTSYTVMRTVISDLGLQTRYFYKDFLSTHEDYKTFPILVDSVGFASGGNQTAAFEVIPLDYNKFQVKTDTVLGEYEFGKTYTNRLGTFRLILNGLPPIGSDSSMIIKIDHLDDLTESYLNRLHADHINDNSTMVELSMIDVVPQRGIDVLNGIVREYNKVTIQDKNELTRSTLQFLDNRIANINNDLQKVEARVETYKLNNEISAESSSNLGTIFETASRYADEQKDIEVQLSILGSMQETIDKKKNEFDLIPSNLANISAYLSDLIDPYNKMVLERNNLLKSAQLTNPVVESMTSQLVSLRKTILSTIINLQSDLNVKLGTIKGQIAGSKEQLRSVPIKERGLLEMKRQQTIIENLYVYLLQKREETAISVIATSANSRIIDAPRSSKFSINPNKKMTYFGGMLGGMILPFLFLLGADIIKDTVETDEDIKNKLPGYNIVGTIVHDRRSKHVVAKAKSKTVIAEGFRTLRTNLQFAHKNKTQTVLVTSSMTEEGKSFIALNLAMTYALVKKKTVIIDFDLRKPKLAKYLNEKTDIGLSNYLADAASAKEILNVSKLDLKLHYITSGPIPPNPSELMNKKKLNDLFAYLKKEYDVIILDTPPIGVVADCIALNSYVSNSIYVVRAGATKKRMLENAAELFDQDKLTNPSIVFNGVKTTGTYSYRYSNYKTYYG